MIPSTLTKGTWPPRARRLAYDLVTGRVPRRRDGEKRRRLLLGTAATAATFSVFVALLDLTVTRRSPSGSTQAASAGELSRRYRESLLDGWEVLQNGAGQALTWFHTFGPWLLLALALLRLGHRRHAARGPAPRVAPDPATAA
ncbi:hypothetical protein [Streptomyces sp. NPDC046862]|uniref:hypothetical protein n=1 Tax=Streptomyces sp. NPDC046862 TaxID=3154603 RepID=UPI0034545C8F